MDRYLSYHPERAVGDSEMECTSSWSAAGGYIVALTVSEDSVLQGVLDLQGAIKGALVAAVIVVSMIVAAMASWMAMQVGRF